MSDIRAVHERVHERDMEGTNDVLLVIDANDELLQPESWATAIKAIKQRLRSGVVKNEVMIVWSTSESRFHEPILRHKRAVIAKGCAVDWIKLDEYCGFRQIAPLQCLQYAVKDALTRSTKERKFDVVLITDGTNPLPEEAGWSACFAKMHPQPFLVVHLGSAPFCKKIQRLVSDQRKGFLIHCKDEKACLVPCVMPRLQPLPPIERPGNIVTSVLAPEAIEECPDYLVLPVDSAQRRKLSALETRVALGHDIKLQMGDIQNDGTTYMYIFGTDRKTSLSAINNILQDGPKV